MSKQILYMDYSLSKSIQVFLSFLIFKGRISEEMHYYLFGDRKLSDDEKYTMLQKHYRDFYSTLAMLTLYDEIIITPIKNVPLIESNILNELGIHYAKEMRKESRIRRAIKDYASISAEEVERIIRYHKKDILCDFIQEKSYIDYWIDYEFNLSDSFEYYLDRKYHMKYVSSSSSSINMSAKISNNEYMRFPQHLLNTGEYDFMEYLDGTVKSLAYSLADQHGTSYSHIFSLNHCNEVAIDDCKAIDDLVLAVDFSAGIKIIPHPETIDEVIAYRRNADVQSFRCVFADWVQVLRNGDIDLACKMRSDVTRANQLLDRLDKYEKLNKNIMIALIKIALSKAFEADLIIAGADFITAYLIDYYKSKNSWVNLPAFNSHNVVCRSLKNGKSKA